MSKFAVAGLFLAIFVMSVPCHGQDGGAEGSLSLSDEFVGELKELRLNAGVQSLSSYSHAYYHVGVEARKTGDSRRAVRAFSAAADMDPVFLDPRFSLFRAYLFSDPARALTELSNVVRLVRSDFMAQYFLLKNLTVMGYIVLLVALAAFTIFAVVRHVGALSHVVAEKLAAEAPPRVAGWLGIFAVLQPVFWGLGAAGTVLCCAGAVWNSMGKRERFFTAVFFVAAVASPFFSAEVARRFPPVGVDSPTYVAYTALRSGWSDEAERALLRAIQARPENTFYHFAYGTMARRAGKLGIARRELETAAGLSPRDASVANNLGNVYFNLGDLESAYEQYSKATSLDASRAESHYNLGQVYTKRLLFAEANEEISKANQINQEMVDEFSLNSREQLNRSVIDSPLKAASYWTNLYEEGTRASSSEALEPVLQYGGIGAQRRSLTVSVFFVLSLVAGGLVFRNLKTYNCTNCGKVICRKCLSRVERQTYCLKCAVAATSAAKSQDFTKLLLANQRQLEAKRKRPVSVAAGIVFPGFGLVQKGRAVSGFFLVLLTATVALCIAGKGSLVDYVPSLPYERLGFFALLGLSAPVALIHALVTYRLYRKPKKTVPALRLVRPAGTEGQLKDGTAGKSGRLRSG